jgi:hypothetical protein
MIIIVIKDRKLKTNDNKIFIIIFFSLLNLEEDNQYLILLPKLTIKKLKDYETQYLIVIIFHI